MKSITYFDDEQKCWTTFSCDDCEDLRQLKVERDAAVRDLHGKCSVCKHYSPYHGRGLCADCKYDFDEGKKEDHWEWRGPQQEET